MPLRLIERFDQRWRDTPVKNQQPPVPPLSLCIPLSLSLSLPLRCSVYPLNLYPVLSHLPYLPTTASVSPPSPFLCKHIHTEGSEQPSCFPQCSSSFLLPRWLLSRAQRRQQHRRTDGPQRSLTPIIAIRQPALISLQHMHMTSCNKQTLINHTNPIRLQ